MPFTLERFAAIRPFLYHLTATSNVARIRRTKRLDCAARIMAEAGDTSMLRQKRQSLTPLEVGEDTIVLRDQLPLHFSNMELADGWSFERYVESLNGRVFFWPGDRSGPNDYGQRHFERYRGENPTIVRFGFDALLSANARTEPLFSKYNSGSPRYTQGLPSPRGPGTFVTASVAAFTASQVVEVTFMDLVRLPRQLVEFARMNDGLWRRLF